MPDITDPEALAFSNEYLRPMAEMMRWLQSSGTEMAAQWNGGTNAKFPNVSTDFIQDNNGTAHPYSGEDANTIVTRLNSLLAVLDAPSAMDGVLPACVRPLQASSGPGG